MIHADKQKYKDILENSVDYLEQHGFEDIKADTEGYETPKSYVRKGKDDNVTPDIVAIKNGRKY